MAYPNQQGPSFCTVCGQPFQAGTSFCRKCGSKLPGLSDAAPVSQQGYTPPSRQSNTPPSQQGYTPPSQRGYIPPSQQGYIPPSQRTYPQPNQNGFSGGYLTPEREPQKESPLFKKQSDGVLIKLVLILLLVRTILSVICNVISHDTFWQCVEHLFAPIPLDYASLMLIVVIGALRAKSTKKLFCCLLAMFAVYNMDLYNDYLLHWISAAKDASGFEQWMYCMLRFLKKLFENVGYPLITAFAALLCAGDGFRAKTRKGISKVLVLAQLIIAVFEMLYLMHFLLWSPRQLEWTSYVDLLMWSMLIVAGIGWLCSGESSRKIWLSLTISAFAVLSLTYLIGQWDSLISHLDDMYYDATDRFEDYAILLRSILSRGVYCVGMILAGTILCRSKSGEETEE